LIAKLSEGSLRDAESLFDQIICLSEPPITKESVSRSLGLVSSDIFHSLDTAIAKKDQPFAFDLAERIFSSGVHLGHFIESLADHYRDHLKNPNSPLTKQQSFAICDYLISWLSEINKTPFKRIHLEMVLLHIIKSAHKISLDSLISRLLELESKLDDKTVTPPIEKVPSPIDIADKHETILDHKTVTPPIEKVLPPVDIADELKKRNMHETIIRFASVELNGSVKKNR